ncbi:MAG: tRNA lysidine(34) synthetase TilS [Gemmatimonadaceae bacterium]
MRTSLRSARYYLDMNEDRFLRAIGAATPSRVVIAVSGGRDSMTLLDVLARTVPERIAAVASFDHGTGTAAGRAIALVRREAAARGLPFRGGRGASTANTEAAWRAARWRFLREVSRECDAVVATAHTRDDHLETLVMRVLRGAGARGLAGLLADTGVARPMLGLSRAAVARYAAERGVRFVSDPSNDSMRHLRNRIRRDLMPAMLAVRPQLVRELLTLSRRAATLRARTEAIAGKVAARWSAAGLFTVPRATLETLTPEGLAMLWPAIAARGGVVLDRRGTRRLVTFTRLGEAGQRIQLAGGYEVTCERDAWVCRRLMKQTEMQPVPLSDGARLGAWRFARTDGGDGSAWTAALPLSGTFTVRPWRPGDRVATSGRTFRRVKRYLREAGVGARQRLGWPVVECAGSIVWVPGVCRDDAATDRSGRPAVHFVCERTDS